MACGHKNTLTEFNQKTGVLFLIHATGFFLPFLTTYNYCWNNDLDSGPTARLISAMVEGHRNGNNETYMNLQTYWGPKARVINSNDNVIQNWFEQKLKTTMTRAYSPFSQSESSIISGRNSYDGLRPSLIWPGPLALKSPVLILDCLSFMFSNCRKSFVFSKSTIQKSQLQSLRFGLACCCGIAAENQQKSKNIRFSEWTEFKAPAWLTWLALFLW